MEGLMKKSIENEIILGMGKRAKMGQVLLDELFNKYLSLFESK